MKQRKIKFRAWNKKLKIMGNVFEMKIDYCSHIGSRDGALGVSVNTYFYLDNKKKSCTGCMAYWDMNNIELIQFTGLLDKNGKEIYENDLFDCIYKFDGCKKHKLEIVWNEISASFRLINHGECHQPNVSKTVGDLERLEVIGNIYENPELLTPQKNK